MSDAAQLTIVQLFPEELGVAGDRGNVMAISARLERAGVAARVVEYRRGDDFPDEADFVVVGSGPLSAMRNIYDDLTGRASALAKLADAGVPIFAFGSGAELLGREIQLLDGSAITGLGLLPLRAVRMKQRSVAYVISDTASGRLVGFEDHASRWELDSADDAFGTLVIGGGNGDGKTEGVISGSVIGTQVGGPLLPLNPQLTDAIIRRALDRQGIEYVPNGSHRVLDTYAEKARAVIEKYSDYKFNSI
jgi:CobQ-like glutamine amidotransferase family enzyme